MRIPPCVRAVHEDLPSAQAFDVWLEGGRVNRVVPSFEPLRGTLLSAFVDAHVHLDKTYTVADLGAARGDLRAAIERSATQRLSWTADDVQRRMGRALDDAWRCGTRAMRTHLDWVNVEPPLALAAFERLREQWRGRIELQIAALTPLDLLAEATVAMRIAARLATTGLGGTAALGAFVYRNDELGAKLEQVFAAAAAHQLALDFHVDEGLEPDAQGLRKIAELAMERRHKGQILCGHACSLSAQALAQAEQTLRLCAGAGIHIVSLPTTNLYLQGAWDHTPVERGVTRLKEAATLGLRPCIASDNVADPFYPYGSYDLFETFGLAVQIAHLAPAGDWLDSITVSPARALGLDWDGRIAEGCPADLICLAACDDHELLTPAGRKRRVLREGQFL